MFSPFWGGGGESTPVLPTAGVTNIHPDWGGGGRCTPILPNGGYTHLADGEYPPNIGTGYGYPPPVRTGWGYPPSGLDGCTPHQKTEQQSEHLIHSGRYASCIHAGGLSYLYNFLRIASVRNCCCQIRKLTKATNFVFFTCQGYRKFIVRFTSISI